MSRRKDLAGQQFRADRPPEQQAVVTTIVGGRPPGSGQAVGEIPRGIEILVKKASVDPEFRNLLLDRRGTAAAEIGLKLAPSERLMLDAVPAKQLQAIIDRTRVPHEHRRAFLGKAAGAMLAVLGLAAGAGTAAGGVGGFGSGGIRPLPAPQPPGQPAPADVDTAQSPPDPGEPFREAPGEAPDSVQGPFPDDPRQPQSVRERLIQIIASRLDIEPEKIDDRTPLPKGGRADAARLAGLEEELEKRFEIKFPFRRFRRFRTVGQIVQYVERAVENREIAESRRQREQLRKEEEARRREEALRRREEAWRYPFRSPVPDPVPPPATLGIRPDRPDKPVIGGIRP
jgi:acyl carrier protein